MIDTIKVAFNRQLEPADLKGWRHNSAQQINNYISNQYLYTIKTPTNGEVVCSFWNRNYTGFPLLTLEFSLPKLLYGNNVQEITDLDWAISRANEIIAELPGIPTVDIAKGELLRLDVSYNHQVGDNLFSYLDYLSRQTVSRRTTHSYLHATIYFSNETISTMFYDKHKQSKLPAARGLLRQEVKYTNKETIRTLFDAKYLGELGFPAIKRELEEDLQALYLDRPILGAGENARNHLVREHGFYAGTFYNGLIKQRAVSPISEIAEMAPRHPRSIDRLVKKAIGSEIAPGFSISGEDLPPLSIDWRLVNDKQINAQSKRVVNTMPEVFPNE